MISPYTLYFKGSIRRNKQYYLVGKPLDCRDGDNLDLLISRETNYDFIVLIKGVEQYPDLGVKIVHPSIDDDSEATDSDKEENNDENAPKTPYDGENFNASSDYEGNNYQDAPETPYDGENMNASSDDEVNNYEVAPDPPTNDVNRNANSNGEKNDYEVNPDTPTNGGIMKTLKTMKKKIKKKNLRRKQIMKTLI